MDEKYWFLKNWDLLERLSPEQVERLESRSKQRVFERNSLVYLPSDRSDSVLLLASGRVKIHHITGEGKQALLAIIDPGEVFGELAIFESGQREEFAETMERSTVIMIPRDEIQRLIEECPHISMAVTKLMGLRRRHVERRLKSLLFRSNRERLVDLLLELAEKYADDSPGEKSIAIKLSHQDLASIIGSTRETVTVLLGELQSAGLLALKRRQILVTDPARLAAAVDSPSIQFGKGKEVESRLLRRSGLEF